MRPRKDMLEWEEAEAASGGIRRLAYALWLQLWHRDEKGEWGALMKESRRSGYDGEIFPRWIS